MNKIFVEDFYDWHPTTLMASKSFRNMWKDETIVVRLCSETNYETGEITYKVYISHNENIDCKEFRYLVNAVAYYNEQLKEV